MIENLFTTLVPTFFRRRPLKLLLLTTLPMLLMVSVAFGIQEKRRLSISGTNITLQKVFQTIKKRTGLTVFYSNELLNDRDKVTVDFKDEDLDRVLTYVLKGRNISYEIRRDKVIVLSRDNANKEVQNLVKERAAAVAVGIPVRGKVSDEKGLGLPGVSILIKGTPQGLVTDVNGEFSIDVPDEAVILVFSFVGYQSQEVVVGNRISMELSMIPDEKSLEEVVIVGYGTQRKTSVTGSVAQVDGKELVNVPVANVSSTLAGRLPGVVAIQRSGQPGSDNTSINIRGFGSALVIVDGVEQDYNQIDPREIESISVLKDASAAIFGARAGNGVILVTTKRGVSGKPKIDFSFSNGFQSNTRLPTLVDAGQYARALNDARRNAGNPIPFTDFQLKAYDYVSDRENVSFTDQEQRQFNDERQNFANTDWVNTVFKPVASIRQYNINSRGGSDKINYFLSLGYLDQQSVLRSGDNKFSRFNFRSNLDAKISDELTVSLDLGGRFENRGYPGYGMTDIWNGVFNDIPIKLLGPDAAYPTGLGQATGNASISGSQKSTTKDFNGALSLTYVPSFVKGLQLKARFNYRNSNTFNKNFIKGYNVYNYDPANGNYTISRPGYTSLTSLTENFSQGNFMTSQVYVNYDRRFGNHDVKAMLVGEYLDNNGNSLNAYRNNFLSGQVQQLFAGSAAGMTNSGGASQDGRISYASRLNYAFKDRYLVEGTFRYDASPRFAKDYRWGFFPGVLVGWRLSEEQFLKNVEGLDELKIRLSYGQSGVDNIANYNFLTGYNYSTGFVENGVLTTGIRSRGLANESTTWERHNTFNAAVDYGFMGGMIYGSVDVFYKERLGILAKRVDALPYSFGAALPSENLNSITYRGIEVVLGHRKSIGKVRYTVEGNIAWNRARNRVIQEPDYSDNYQRLRYQNSGQWANRYFGYQAAGLFQSQEEINAWPVVQDNNGNKTLVPGDIKYLDFNNDGKLTELDMTPIGRNNTPELTYGLNATLNWKGIDFSMLWQGASRYGITMEAEQRTFPYNTSTIFEYNLDYWTPENTGAQYPRIVAGGGASNNRLASSFWLHDATYIRLKNIQIGYTLPGTVMRNVKLSGCRVYVSAANLLTLSNVPYYDPEAPNGSQWYFPQQKTISIGFNLNL